MTYDNPNVYQRVLEGISTVAMLFDDQLRLIFINPAGEILYRVSSRHLLGQTIDSLMDYEKENMPSMQEVLESGHTFTRHELKIVLPDQRDIMIDLTVNVINEPKSGRQLLVEMSRLDRLLKITRDASLWAQQEATRQLLKSLAHEVKNPLGGLRGAAQLLERELNSEELKEYTQVIIGEADRLQNLVNRILGPNQALHKKMTNVHEILERVRSLMLAEKHGEGLNIQRDYDPSLPDIEADTDCLIQAVLNIVRNAVQAVNSQGTITLRTRIIHKHTIGHERHRLVMKIDIIDSGPGISEELLERIFFPMITGRAEGTGLGLSIAQSLVQQHGGIIECQSEPGNTVFTIYLPIDETGAENGK